MAAVALAGCGGQGGSRIFEDPHGTISVKPGTAFALSLPENSGVGFTWRLAEKPAGGVVDSTGESYKPERENLPGSGSRHRFEFRARHAGRTRIRLRESFRGRPRARRTVIVEVR